MDLQTGIETYHSPKVAGTLLEQAHTVTVSSIPGGGKDAVKGKTLDDPRFMAVVSHTTRFPRMNNGVMEKDGVDYHFVGKDFFLNMMRWQKFVEVMPVYGNMYGTSLAAVSRVVDAGKVAINDLDTQGVGRLHELTRNITPVFIVPPSFEVWQSRWRKRYKSEEDFQLDWTSRRNGMIGELARALDAGYYHFVINDTLEEASAEIVELAFGPKKAVQLDIGRAVAESLHERLLDQAA